MDYNKEVLGSQYNIVSFFVNHLAYFRGLEAANPRINNHQSFWAVTSFGHLKLAVLEWCKVFGSPSEEMHWTKTPTGNTAKQAREDFLRMVLSETGFTPQQWKDFHQEMLTFRNKFLAHLNPNGVLDMPPFKPALQVAYAYDDWVKGIESTLKKHDSLKFRYEEWKAEASSVVSLYPHP
jgi:hypothetical protein